MNSETALNLFDSALSVMAAHARMHTRADDLTRKYSAFRSFDDLIKCNRNYRPSINMNNPEKRELADLYDAAQETRGDDRRAYRFGSCRRKGSLIDRDNWDASESFYALRDRRAFYDRRTRQWIAYTVCERGYQVGCAEFYHRAGDLLACEHIH